MTLRQLCNVTYSLLAQDRDRVQMAELEELLADPGEKEGVRARHTMEAMEALAASGMRPLIPPGAAEAVS